MTPRKLGTEDALRNLCMSDEEIAQVRSLFRRGRGAVHQRRGAKPVGDARETTPASTTNHAAMQTALANSLEEENIKVAKKESLDEAEKGRRKKERIMDMIQVELFKTMQDVEEVHFHVACPDNQATMMGNLLRLMEKNIQHILSATG